LEANVNDIYDLVHFWIKRDDRDDKRGVGGTVEGNEDGEVLDSTAMSLQRRQMEIWKTRGQGLWCS
jgi:cytidylate kinase